MHNPMDLEYRQSSMNSDPNTQHPRPPELQQPASPDHLLRVAQLVREPGVVHAVGFKRCEIALVPELHGLQSARDLGIESVRHQHAVQLVTRPEPHGLLHRVQRVDGLERPRAHAPPTVLSEAREVELDAVERVDVLGAIEQLEQGREVVAVEAAYLWCICRSEVHVILL